MHLQLNNLDHTYSTRGFEARTILNIDQWSVAPGEQVLLRGISGSGKTTLMNILSGLLQPTNGEVFLGEQLLFELSEASCDRFRARHIGYIFQTHMLVPNLSALDNTQTELEQNFGPYPGICKIRRDNDRSPSCMNSSLVQWLSLFEKRRSCL